MSKKTVLITGGGTGGHLSPAIALYEECKKQNVKAYVLVGNNDRKFNYLREIDSRNLIYYSAPSFSKNPLYWPIFLIKFVFAIMSAKRIMNFMYIDAVIGMGGYVSGPALIAASLTKRDIYLCEQNTVPGKVTVKFAKKAKRIFTTFDDSKNFFKPLIHEKLLVAGNPIRKKVISDMDKDAAKQHFNLGHCDKIVLLIGGSQGALQLNDLILNLKLKYNSEFSNTGIIWCTGSLTYDRYLKIVKENDKMGSIYLSPFVEDVGIAYRAADIAISRSGSGVMVEMAAMELPSILIPYPYAADDHQSKNADAFARDGAAVKMSSTKVEDFAPLFFQILSSDTKLGQMKKACVRAAKPEAAADIINSILGDR